MTAERPQITHSESNTISLKEIISKSRKWCRYLISKWIYILCVALLGGLLAFLYATTKKPIYTATTTFVLEDEKAGQSNLGSLAGLASLAGVDVGNGGGIFQGDNILELYKSRTMIRQTLLTDVVINHKRQTLIDKYIEFNELKEKWAKDKNLLNLTFSKVSVPPSNIYTKADRLRDSVIFDIVDGIIRNNLTVEKLDKKLSIIKVDVRSQDEIFAKHFNNAIVSNVNDFYLRTKTKKSIQNINIIQHKTDSVRAVMNGAIYASVAVADATPNLNPTRQVQRVVPSQRAQFSAETNKAILSSLVQNLEMSKMSLMKETPLLEVIDQPVYPLQVERTSKIKFTVLGVILSSICVIIYFTIKKYLSLL